jgi:hypothetical protein
VSVKVDVFISQAKQEINEAWTRCGKMSEQEGLTFGQTCYEWQQKLVTKGGVGNKGKGIVAILQQLSIPERTAYWWITKYKESQEIGNVSERRKNRNEPVDDFEEIRACAIKMLNVGLQEMRKTEANHSLLDSAKTWATNRLKQREEVKELEIDTAAMIKADREWKADVERRRKQKAEEAKEALREYQADLKKGWVIPT